MVAKAEQTGDKANPRFMVTNLGLRPWLARAHYEDLYCARGEMESRIKKAQPDLFGDRLSAQAFRVNQMRLWLATSPLCCSRRCAAWHWPAPSWRAPPRRSA